MEKTKPSQNGKIRLVLLTNSMMDIIDNCEIKPSVKLDHCIIELRIKLNNLKLGKGVWKLKHALPVYNLDYLTQSNNNVQFTIDDDTFLEALILQIRGETIKYSSKFKHEQNLKENQLLNDIEDLQSSHNAQISSDILEDKRLELESIQNEKIKGRMIRSHMQWLTKAEKPTSYFCKLKNTNFVNKTIKKLKLTNNSIITDQK